MDDDGITPEPRGDAWALADLDAAIAVVGATVGSAYGPIGAIVGPSSDPTPSSQSNGSHISGPPSTRRVSTQRTLWS